jgi:membrane-associated phospholipid phosphatase
VHSPCDIVAGWIIGVIVLFVYCGFADRLHAFYAAVAEADTAERSWNPAYFAVACIVALYCHPRAWPETQTYGEVKWVFLLT